MDHGLIIDIVFTDGDDFDNRLDKVVKLLESLDFVASAEVLDAT